MSKIVVLSTFYLNKASANGICARNLVNELVNKNNEVDIICFNNGIEKETEQVNVHLIDLKYNNKKSVINQFFLKAKKLINLFFFRKDSFLDQNIVNDYLRLLKNINSVKDIDAVIAMYFPLESIEALYRFKKMMPNVKALIYELDSVGDGVANSRFQTFYNRLNEKWISKIYELIDYIIVMQSHQDYWMKVFGHRFISKLRIADIPILSEKPTSTFDNSAQISMLYSGIIEKKYRSPSYLLAVLKELTKSIHFEFAFYSKGDCEDEIADMVKESHGISQKGFVSQEELEHSILSTDFLISIGNSVSRSVPSKLISYISYGKPIIHFSTQKDDVCTEYLAKYPLGIIIDQSMPIEVACEKISFFIKKTRGKVINYETIQKAFYMNVPSFSAILLCDLLDERGDIEIILK